MADWASRSSPILKRHRSGKIKIFLTYNAAEDLICVKLKPEDQQSFELVAKGKIFAVPNKWGLQGWTLARLNQLEKDLYDDLIQTALSQFK
ncbi:MAG: hypothetical protein IPK46_02115 [Saprospiraceae bacterium]|nr:hypothetical protein [Saprospiraceae bacterium]